ncbi:30S ribosomal protein S2 [Flavobacteriaceae bacterium TP-CH-4]|uniref:Small ribosomal subunit protein uS2 n=1 Tax=Pelagihabitans pacificus TaxID=2696054 RepID=A0A967AXI6_9FLAO|nr:30S ribosomal protein S2 [Pelagihabitans pacificus]NHF58406.1 30S ribosomal protein S2 [Pelagihabitans pacificus]
MAKKVEVKDLLEAGVHFGHLTRKWNPNMAPYIYMERNGIHVINLYKTVAKLEEANEALKKIAASGRKILFVATKKQAKDIVAEKVANVNMPYITERWPGGMLTNFVTIRKAVKKMASIDRMKKDGTFLTLSKKERLQVDRLRAKLEKNLGSISEMTRLPGAIFIVDTMREHIAVKEAQKLNIPIFAMVDTNSDPRDIDFLIPSNDDASKSIEIIMQSVTDAVAEGLSERKSEKQAESEGAEPKKEEKVVKEAPEIAKVETEPIAKDETKEIEEAPVVADTTQPEPTPETVETKAPPVVAKNPRTEVDVEEVKEEVAKEKSTSKKASKSDDLTKIEGVGPKAAEALANAGFETFGKLAKADADKIKEILTEASSRMAHLDPTSWPKQAQMAADEKWDELKEWQDKAKGGVE